MTQPLNQPGSIHQKIILIMSMIGSIGKTRRNESQSYNFRGIDDIYNALHPLLVKHGVFCVPKIIDDKREDRPTRDGKGTLITTLLTVEYTFYAADGSSVVATVKGEGMDSGDKSANKAMTSAHKNALTQIFSIPTEEADDSEKHSPEVGTTKKEPGPVHKLPQSADRTAANAEHRRIMTEGAKATDYGDTVVPFGAERVKIKTLSRDALVKKVAWAKDKPHYKEFVEKAQKFLNSDGLESAFGERAPLDERLRTQERKAS